jgi:Cys-tRNA(Pro)/Cys-tRNA(Cys) deacylase
MTATRGTQALEEAAVAYRLLRYDYAAGGAEEAADALDVERERMLKSLVALADDEPVFALVPAGVELAPKKLAAAAGAKAARMATRAEAERITGYHAGGMSPLGARRALRVFLDEPTSHFDAVCLNAGGRGHIVEVLTGDLMRVTAAQIADLRAS